MKIRFMAPLGKRSGSFQLIRLKCETRKLLALTFLFSFYFLALKQPAICQNIEDLKNIDVQNLTDEQLLTFQSEIRSRGLSQEELLTLARLNGISQSKIQELQLRLATIGSTEDQPDIAGRTRNQPIVNEVIYVPEGNFNTAVFGSSFFRNAALTFEPSVNIPTPQNYRLGAGDELFIDIWGDAQKSYQLTLSPEGAILIPDVGPIFLNGKTVTEAERIVIRRIKTIFSSLGETSNALVTLGQTRSIKVHIVGEVKFPGTFTLSPFSSAFNALYQARGPNENGSFRNIKIRRGGSIKHSLDIYDFLLANSNQSITLEDQDVIIVPPFQKRVQVKGSVKRPAIYEIENDENLSDLLDLTGGFSSQAFKSRIRIIRNLDSYRSVLTIESADFDKTELIDGDQVIVSGINSNLRNKLYIGGQVYQPGYYQLEEKITLGVLISKAYGLTPEAYTDQALLFRKDENFEDYVISVDLKDSKDYNLPLKAEDSLVVKSKDQLTFHQRVTIRGPVDRPGSYRFIRGLTINQLLYLSGGFLERADTNFAEISLPLLKNFQGESVSVEQVAYDQFDSYQLQPNSTVLFRQDPSYLKERLVLVEGEVNSPGYYAIDEGAEKRVSDVIMMAGGLKPTANVNGMTLVRIPEYFDENSKTGDRLKLQVLQEISEESLEDESIVQRKEYVGLDFDEILKKPGGKYDLLVKDGDIISVPDKVQTIRVSGEVQRPGSHRYDDQLSFKDYISRAGGFSDKARRKKAFLVYSNGNTIGPKSFLGFRKYPKLQSGAEIVVPTKIEKRKLSTQEILGLTSSILAIGLLIDRFGR